MMAEQSLNRRTAFPMASRTCRDILMPVFRQHRVARLIFIGVLAGCLVGALVMPRKYEAEMKILVNRDRVDAVVTPDQDAPVSAAAATVVSEEDLNSEVELLRSRDLLEKVVQACNLEPAADSGWRQALDRGLAALRIAPLPGSAARRARAVEALESSLVAGPLKKTDLIRVAYTSRDPQLSAQVLQSLAALYQEKHAAVHRPIGTFAFFDEQAGEYRDAVQSAEAKLADFDSSQGVVDPEAQQQLLLQKVNDLESEWQREESAADGAASRAQELKSLAGAIPERQTTQIRTAENAELLAQLQSTLLALTLKRSDMLTKYADSYPPVAELSDEIAQTQKAVTDAKRPEVEDAITDRVPTQDWIATELAKAQADQAAARRQAAVAARAVTQYRLIALDLDSKSTERADLVRDVKIAEENDLLYERKREAARISDALDRQRIVNVSIAEAATVPAFPTLRLGWLLIGGFFAAGTLSIGSAYAADRLSPRFHSPEELSRYLDLQILGAIPVVALTDAGRDEKELPW